VKKYTLFVLPFFLISLLLNGCQQLAADEKPKEKQHNQNSKEVQSIETKTLDVKETVWNQLTEKDKKHIQGAWKDASFRKVTLQKEMGTIYDSKFIGKEVFIVDYPSNDNPTLGGIGVFADIKSHQLIGYGYREY